MATKSTFETNLTKRKELGDQLDALDEAIVTEFLVEAAPVIEKLRQITDKMSDNVSFKGRAAQVLQQIDNGLLRDPLALLVVEKLTAAQTAAAEAAAASTSTASTKS